MEPGKGEMTVREAGRKGGNAVKKKYGPDFFARNAKKGGEAIRKEKGRQFYAEIGSKGGKARAKTFRDK